MRSWPVCAFVVLVSSCATRLVPLEPERALPPPAPNRPLEVVSSVAGGDDPLPVGCSVAFGGVAHAVGEFVASAAEPWAWKHQAQRPGGWQLAVELTRSRASSSGDQLTVELFVRLTLRAAVGQVYLAQATAHCKDTDTFSPNQPTRVVYQCMEHLAQDVAGWLEAVNP